MPVRRGTQTPNYLGSTLRSSSTCPEIFEGSEITRSIWVVYRLGKLVDFQSRGNGGSNLTNGLTAVHGRMPGSAVVSRTPLGAIPQGTCSTDLPLPSKGSSSLDSAGIFGMSLAFPEWLRLLLVGSHESGVSPRFSRQWGGATGSKREMRVLTVEARPQLSPVEQN